MLGSQGTAQFGQLGLASIELRLQRPDGTGGQSLVARGAIPLRLRLRNPSRILRLNQLRLEHGQPLHIDVGWARRYVGKAVALTEFRYLGLGCRHLDPQFTQLHRVPTRPVRCRFALLLFMQIKEGVGNGIRNLRRPRRGTAGRGYVEQLPAAPLKHSETRGQRPRCVVTQHRRIAFRTPAELRVMREIETVDDRIQDHGAGHQLRLCGDIALQHAGRHLITG